MRIGIFGNTNNYPLMLAMALRRLGHQSVLVVNRRDRLHRPESKYPEMANGYPWWILDASDIPEEEFAAATPRIAGVLDFLAGGSDALLLNDIGPSLLEFCDAPAMAIMTGSDVTYYANPATPAHRQREWSPEFAGSPAGRLSARRWTELVARQRNGIRQAASVSAPFPGLVPELDTLLDDIGVSPRNRHFIFIGDTSNPPARRDRSAGPLRIVNGARLNWCKPLPEGFCSQDHKGTDVLLNGFRAFLAAGGDAELVLFRKGLHVAETEALAASLGVNDRIRWRDEVTLREFYDEIAGADIVCDQFGESFPGLVALDAMAMGLPVIANFRPEIMRTQCPEPVAACQASTAGELAAHLATLAASPDVRRETGRVARQFAHTHMSPEAHVRHCLQRLQDIQ